MAEFSQPIFYRYYEHQILKAKDFGFHEDVFLLVFGPNIDDLADPRVEPIGVYHHAGIRQYIWRDAFWSETDWDRRHVQKRVSELIHCTIDETELIRLRCVLELTVLAIKSGAPSPTDGRPPLKDPLSMAIMNIFKIPVDEFLINKNKQKRYCRAVYRINAC
jgi:hypothetical protein